MTIVASAPQTVPLRANPPAPTQARAQIAGRSPQLDRSSSINKAALDCLYLLSPCRGSKQPTPAATAIAPLPEPNPHSAAPLSRS